MDVTYNLDGNFKPATKRFADLDGPDFYPTPRWATFALIEVRCSELFRVDPRAACRVVEAAAGSSRGRIVVTQPRRRRSRPARRLRFGKHTTRRLTRSVAALAFCLTIVWLLGQ